MNSSASPILFAALLLLFTPGCLDLDGFVHNPRHCSDIGAQTCEDVENPFNRFCTPCDMDYDWTIEPPWPDGFFAEGESLRPITDIEPITLETEDGLGTLDMYWIPSHGEQAEIAELTIVYQHGNFGSIEHFVPRMQLLYELGYNVLIWDYRGYGKSTPSTAPLTEDFLADARQVLNFTFEKAPDPSRVLVYGMSLGAVPSLEMVLHQPPCALILEAAFTSIQEISDTNIGVALPGGFVTQGYFENVDRIRGYEGPLMVLHGIEDNLFPPESIQNLYDNAPGPKVLHLIEGARHGLGDGVPETTGFRTYGQFLTDFLQAEATACL